MNFIAKALLKKQLKHLPQDQVNMILTVIEKNPEFFQKIAAEIKVKMDSGKDQQSAAMEVMQSHAGELKQIMGQ